MIARISKLAGGMLALLFVGTILSVDTALHAQQTTVTTTPAPETTPYPAPPYYGFGGFGGGGGGWGWGLNNGIGSTAAGSYLGGLGEAIRAQGQYNLMSSQAAINLQEADRRAMENQINWTNTYFEKRRINQAYKDANRGPRPSHSDWVRLAQDNAPKRLQSNSLDSITGQIIWPPALQAEIFAQDRANLEALFAQRASTDGAVGLDTYNKIRTSVDATLEKLKGQIRNIDTRNYLEARTFLTGLAREADFPTT
jgi:hypothetical protein